MRLDIPDLTGTVLAGLTDRPDLVTELRSAAQRRDGAVPFLLLPVRLETRFAQAEVPVAGPAASVQLAAVLRTVARHLESLAERNHATTLPTGWRNRKAAKRATEDPIVAQDDVDLSALSDALDAVPGLLRDLAAGRTQDATAVAEAAARVEVALPRAATSLAGLRSEFHRTRLLARLAKLDGPARDAVAKAPGRARAGVRIVTALGDRPSGEVTLAGPKGSPVPQHRLTESALAFAELKSLLGDPTRLAEPEALTQAQRWCTEIAVLPEDWKQELLTSLDASRTRTTGATSSLQLETLRESVAGLATATGRGTGPITPLPVATHVVDQLRVRIFPDDIAVQNHESGLTEGEVTAGAAYWAARADGGGDETASRAAWRALCLKYGPQRAAWIALLTRPPEPPAPDPRLVAALEALTILGKRVHEVSRAPRRGAALIKALDVAVAALRALTIAPPEALERIRTQVATMAPDLRTALERAERPDAARLTALEHAVEALKVDRSVRPDIRVPATRTAVWTRAPSAGLLPSRFAVVAVSDGAISRVAVGAPVRRDLALGLDPTERTEDGQIPSALAWMVDYDVAVELGMAVTIDITPHEAAAGFDRVYVLGIGPEADPASVAQDLSGLLDGHHYGPNGLSLVPVGTPTNATEGTRSGYRGRLDPDAAYDVEQRDGLVTSTADDVAARTDGGRLARALGIDPGHLDHVAGAGGRDVDSAVAVNEALWPATLGYALEEVLGSLVGRAARDRVRSLVVPHALGRGVLPTLRVGAQPYGVLPSTALSRWRPTDPNDAVERVLHDVLTTMWADWTAAREVSVLHAHTPDVADAQQHVLRVLGLDASAVSFAQRFTANAGRRAISVGSSTLHVGLPADGTVGDPAGPFALLAKFARVLERAGRGSGDLREPGPLPARGTIRPAWADTYDRLETSRAYEVRLLAQTVPLDVTGAPADVAAQVDALLLASIDSLAADAAQDGRGQPLLLMLLRQALLVQAREVALGIVERDHLLDAELLARIGSARLFRFATRSGDVRVTRWSVLRDPLDAVLRVLGPLSAPSTSRPSALPAYLANHHTGRLADYVDRRGDNPLAAGYAPAPTDPRHDDLLDHAREHAGAVRRVGALAPAALDQLLAEHLDLCSHRLDSWLLALPAARLDAMRAVRPVGLHVGAFGWVEDLRPRPLPLAAAAVPTVLDSDPRSPVRADPADRGGFVHAPSLNHAVTAAILRSGYLAQRTGSTVSARRMAVNLSSRRTRSALDALDGISAGNELGAILGYQFERDLHDGPLTAAGAALDVFIPRLRAVFPSVVPALRPDGTAPDGADTRAERLVVDGLRLLQTVLDSLSRGEGTLLSDLRAGGSGGYAAYPYRLQDHQGPMLPARTDIPALEAVLAAVDRMADTVDALGDLVLAEGVHQLVQGNHVRAAAALSALAEGKAPPRPEVVDTPVPGRTVTYRLLLQLPPLDARELDAGGTGSVAPGWGAVPMTPRAAAEPTLNRWLGTLLGPPGATRVRVVGPDGLRTADVTLTMLGWQPIDLLACLHDGFEDGLSELAPRVLDALRPLDVGIGEPSPTLQVDLERDPSWPADVRSLAEAAALLESLATVVTGGRSADAGDYLLADTVPESVGVPAGGAGTGGAVLDELATRVAAAIEGVDDLAMTLLDLLSDGAADSIALDGDASLAVDAYRETYRGGAAPGEHLARLDALWLRRDDLRRAVLAAGEHGVRGVTPPTRWLTRDQVATELLEAAETAYVAVATRRHEARRALGAVALDGPVPVDRATKDRLVGALAAIFGPSLPVLPLFVPRNGDELTEALAAPLTAEPRAAVARWLNGVAAVREPTAALSTSLVIAEAFGTPPPSGQPVQLPHVAGDSWLGEGFPASQPPGDRLSLVLLGTEHLEPAGLCAGLLVDTWSEVIPTGSVTTGLSFRYDAPDATAPQVLLLAVPPQAGSWRWEDLLLTLHETFELAKDRAVEPEHVQGDVYGQLLPALLGEVPAHEGDGAGGDRVVLDFADTRPTETT